MRALTRVAIGLALTAACAVGACRWLLPERFAVNAPIANSLFGSTLGAPEASEIQERMRVPAGYSLSVFAEVDRARMLEFTATGDLLVSAPRDDRVWLVQPDRDGDGRSDAARPLEIALDRPHGLHIHDGWLYVGEGSRVSRVRYDAVRGATMGELEPLADLPEGGNHWSRTVAVGPDRKLYVSVGSSCNVCVETDERRAAVLRFELDGSNPEIYATGLRNAVGFDWQPSTGALYATDNGRDLLGDDFPPCELNRIEQGGFYGWPIANGARIPDPDFGDGQEARIQASIGPAHEFRAHNAPLGITFVHADHGPAEYRGAALVALHGSWNRTRKDGYKVVSLHWDEAGRIEERDFVTGFEVDGDVIGRPVDVAVGPDDAIYVSDDYAGVIWRVARGGVGRPASAAPPALRRRGYTPLAALDAAERRARGERGARLFALHECGRCHDPERAEPGIVPARLARLSERYDLERLARFFNAPTPPMPVLPLSDQDRRDLAVHLFEHFD